MGKFDKDRGRNRNEHRESVTAANKTPLGRPSSGFGAKSPGSGGGGGGSLLKPAYLMGAIQEKQSSSPSSSSSSSSFSPQKPPSSFSSFSSYNSNYGGNNNNSKNTSNTHSQSQSRFGNQDYSSASSSAAAASSYSTDYYNSGSNTNRNTSGSESGSYGNYNQNQNRYNQNQNRSSSYSSSTSGDNNTSNTSASSYQNYQNYGNNNTNNNSNKSGNGGGTASGRYSNDAYALATIPQFPTSTSSQFSSSSSFMSMSGGNGSSNSGSMKRDYNVSMGSGGNNYGSTTATTSSIYGGFENYIAGGGSSTVNTKIDDSSTTEDGSSERKRRKKSRWMGEVDEKAVIPGMPTILPSGLADDQQEIYISELQVQEITRKLRSGDLGIPPALENRSPSPEPMYGADGKRLNTREYRTRKKLEEERHKLITRLRELNPEYKPPSDYRQPTVKIVDRVSIPQEEYPDINFVGLLIGPRGNTLKGLEKDTGAKIIIRGKGSVKEGKVGGKAGQPLPGEDEPLHAYVTSNNPENVKKACEKIKDIIRQGIDMPESQNDLRKTQLRELALLNGTLREGEGPKCSNCGVTSHRTWNCPDKPNVTSSVVCTVCGGAGHIAKDCRMKRPGSSCPPTGAAFNYQEKAKIDEEYMSLMAELGEGKSKDGNGSLEAPQRILRNRPPAAGPSLFDKPLVPLAIAGPSPSSGSSSSSQQQKSYQSKNYGNQSQRQPSSSSQQQQQHQYQQRQNKNPQQQQRNAPPPPPPSSSSSAPPQAPILNMPPPNYTAPPPPTSPSTPQGNPYYSGTYPPSFQGGWGGSYSSSVPPPPGWGTPTPWGVAPPPPPTSSAKPPLPPS